MVEIPSAISSAIAAPVLDEFRIPQQAMFCCNMLLWGHNNAVRFQCFNFWNIKPFFCSVRPQTIAMTTTSAKTTFTLDFVSSTKAEPES